MRSGGDGAEAPAAANPLQGIQDNMGVGLGMTGFNLGMGVTQGFFAFGAQYLSQQFQYDMAVENNRSSVAQANTQMEYKLKIAGMQEADIDYTVEGSQQYNRAVLERKHEELKAGLLDAKIHQNKLNAKAANIRSKELGKYFLGAPVAERVAEKIRNR